jgi:Tfp pilus assembly protein PilP
MKKLFILTLILTVIFSLSGGFTQEQEQPPKEEEQPETTGAVASSQEPASLDDKVEMDIDPNVFVYRPMGRRDPFKNLLQGKESTKRAAVEGIAGLTIGELVLEGIVYGKGEFRAYVKGPDNTPYSLRVGDNVYNGKVVEINANAVIFKQILTVALGGTKERTVAKYLNPEDEEKTEEAEEDK